MYASGERGNRARAVRNCSQRRFLIYPTNPPAAVRSGKITINGTHIVKDNKLVTHGKIYRRIFIPKKIVFTYLLIYYVQYNCEIPLTGLNHLTKIRFFRNLDKKIRFFLDISENV